MDLTVTGRSHHLTATATTVGQRVIIRLDDGACPEFWAEVTLSADQLRQLLAEMEDGPHPRPHNFQGGHCWEASDGD